MPGAGGRHEITPLQSLSTLRGITRQSLSQKAPGLGWGTYHTPLSTALPILAIIPTQPSSLTPKVRQLLIQEGDRAIRKPLLLLCPCR